MRGRSGPADTQLPSVVSCRNDEVPERSEELHYFPNDVPCCLVVQPWRRKPSSRVRDFAETVDNNDGAFLYGRSVNHAIGAPRKALARISHHHPAAGSGEKSGLDHCPEHGIDCTEP